MNKASFIILGIILCLSSCKKYEDDQGLFTFRTVKSRICQNWQIETFQVNGLNKNDSITDLVGSNPTISIRDESCFSEGGTVLDGRIFSADTVVNYSCNSAPCSIIMTDRFIRFKLNKSNRPESIQIQWKISAKQAINAGQCGKLIVDETFNITALSNKEFTLKSEQNSIIKLTR